MADTHAVKKSNLLTEDQIDLKDNALKQSVEDKFTKAMEDHRQDVVSRLESQQKLASQTSVDVAVLKEIVQNHIVTQTEWRATDVKKWQESENDRETKRVAIDGLIIGQASIRKHQDEMKKRLQLVAWLLMATKVVSVTVSSVVDFTKKSKEFWLAVTGISSVIVLLWTVLSRMIPAFHYYFVEHHPFHWFF